MSTLLRLALLLPLMAGAAVSAPQQAAYDSPPIQYSKTKPADPVASLDARLAAGQASLAYDGPQGYLKSVLKALDIPVSSQALVFSKTSFQRQWINPRAPRALYFNDDTYLGWVQGGDLLEVASQDPALGTIFYTVSQDAGRRGRFIRQTDACLQCHDSTSLTLGVPGVTVRSVFPAADGQPRFNLGGFRTTYRSPFEERWGGWYVTGTHGAMRHLGNISFPDDPTPDLKSLRDGGANVQTLEKKVETDGYPAGTSDIVALMVLEHQTAVHNLITRANHEVRLAVVQSDELNKATGAPLRPLLESTRRRIGYACEPLIEALLFSGEFPLTDRVKGISSFSADFEQRGPLDSKGRSLRQFDLSKRMFKHPLSYLVYSRPFAGLPVEAKDHIAGRMKDILGGKDPKPEFAHLGAEDRKTIVEILADTLPTVAAAWK